MGKADKFAHILLAHNALIFKLITIAMKGLDIKGCELYETPAIMEVDIISHGLLCTSTFTELENYNFLGEQAW